MVVRRECPTVLERGERLRLLWRPPLLGGVRRCGRLDRADALPSSFPPMYGFCFLRHPNMVWCV
jgi:hypothetical protein